MKLNTDEKNFINKLSAISGYDTSTIRDVFFSVLLASVLEMYSGTKKEIHLPYLFKFKIDYIIKKENSKKKSFELEEKYNFTTSQHFHNLLVKIESGKTTEVEEWVKKEIAHLIDDILDLNQHIPLDEDN